MILMSLFSVFDPVSIFGFSINWLILLVILFLMPSCMYVVGSNYENFWINFHKMLGNMFKEISGNKYLGFVWVSVGIFMYLMLTNIYGLIPFIFTSTAHPMFTMGLGCVLWLSFFLMGWLKSFINSAAHLVPEGSPLMLAPVLVIVESISHLIRPFTLSIRLAANMMAGHLIVGLLASISLINITGFMSSFFFQSLLLVLEVGVAIIQGFVFSILVLLYALEYY